MRIINIEGVDCSGKSTLCKEIAKKYNRNGMNTKVIHFPRYETEVGERISEALYNPEKMKNRELQMLYLMDQLAFSSELKEGVYDDYDVLILDRYFLSTTAYSLAKGGTEEANSIFSLHKAALDSGKLARPDAIYLLTASKDDKSMEILEKRVKNKKNKDVFEEINFLKFVDSCYVHLLTKLYLDIKNKKIISIGTPMETKLEIIK